MPTEALRKALRAVARGDDALLTDYGGVLGSRSLRRILLGRLATEGLQLGQDQVLLTGSGTHAVDLTCRYLLRPGDTVVVDDPCYFNFRALLRAHQVQVVGVPYTPTGPDVERFEAVLKQASPRLYLTNAGLQNPTGAGIAPQTAHRLLNLAAAHDLTIIEDDLFADLEPEPTTRLAALDGLNRVIRIGSFSKTLSASLRCGYIAARVDRISDLADLQVATGFVGASPVAAEAIAHVLAGGGYRKHLDEVHRRLARKRREVIARLRSIGVEPWIEPRGGFNLWCRLPGEIDSAELARAALKEDIVLAPGDVFSPSQTASRFMRVNVTHCDDPRLMSFLRLGLSG
jgi:DNA-binding transcriptional MocR family regulator